MAAKNTFRISGEVVDTYSGTGKRGEFHTAVVNVGREVKLFSEVAMEGYKGQTVSLECSLAPDFQGNATVRIVGVVSK